MPNKPKKLVNMFPFLSNATLACLRKAILALVGGLSAAAIAQSPVEQCGSEGVHILAMGTNPNYAQAFATLRAHLSGSNRSLPSVQDVYTIPVVVHVVHRGSPVGVDENISDAQILSAIEGLNNDFRKTPGTPGDGIGVDTFIQFELAKRTPEGEPTNGIVRVNGNSVPGFAEHGISNGEDVDAADQTAVKQLTTWYGDDYINIFVVPEINGNDGGWGLQGFTYLGPTYDARDGIVVLYNVFGLVGDLKPERDMNRTITHQMGHHLSLWHTFSNTSSCASESNCNTQGDEVCDTPPTLVNDLGCALPVCEGAQVQNYMDHTPQDCKNAFTAGQTTRMRGCLQSVRQTLLTSLALTPVVDKDLTVSGVSNLGSTTCLPSAAPVVLVTNFGTEPVSGFQLTTTLNGGTTIQTSYVTEVPPTATVEAPLPEFVLGAENTFMFEVQLLGGAQDDFTTNNTLEYSVDVTAGEVLTMTLTTYMLGHHIDWSIRNDQDEVLMSGGDYESGIVATYVTQGCVAAGCHTLVMEDVGGDGMCAFDMSDDGVCDFGGTMSLTNSNGDVLAGFDVANSNFGSQGIWEVCATSTFIDNGCVDENTNGICDDAEISGCQDVEACNFTPDAILDNGSCTYAETHYDCEGNCLVDTDGDGICDELEVVGCQDVNACNYNANATDSGACNYANTYYNCDGSCIADADGDNVCDELEISGCTASAALNYDPVATDDDGSCEFPLDGCMDPSACNYNPLATNDTGNCTYAEANYTCTGQCINDIDGNGVCDEFEIEGCTDSNACNYDPVATVDDGSCSYVDTDGDGVCDGITFNVDMACAPSSLDNVFVTGPWCGWCANDSFNTMTDTDGDGVYTVTVPDLTGTVEYKYAINGFADQENLINDMFEFGADCAPITDYYVYANRTVEAGEGVVVFDYYGTCDGECNDVILTETLVTFHVDMSGYEGTEDPSQVTWNSYANGWCGNCAPLDDLDGDGIYSITVPLTGDTVIYKFAIGAWADQENLDPDLGCFDIFYDQGAPNGCCYVNRFVALNGEEAIDMPVVCWNSCDACDYVRCADFDFNGAVFGVSPDPALGETFNDGLVGQPYEDVLHLILPTNTEDIPGSPVSIPLDSVVLEDLSLIGEMGEVVALSEIGLVMTPYNDGDSGNPYAFLGGNQYCASITGTPDSAGVFTGLINTTAWVTVPILGANSIPFPFEGFTLTIISPAIPGCTDASACNYDMDATMDDGSCTNDVDGDGVCDELEVGGCTDMDACNYNVATTDDDGSCTYAADYYDCDGNCLNDSDGDGVCDELEVEGCMDALAFNFEPTATDDDGSCVLVGEGCEVSPALFDYISALSLLPEEVSSMVFGVEDTLHLVLALPYVINEPSTGNPYGTMSFEVMTIDGLPPGLVVDSLPGLIMAGTTQCLIMSGTPTEVGLFDVVLEGQLTLSLFGQPYVLEGVAVTHPVVVEENPNPIAGCTYELAANYLSFANLDDGSCVVGGCTDPDACNHQPLAEVDDGSCDYDCLGCTYDQALNFNPQATRDDGTCQFPAPSSPCPADLDGNGSIGSGDLLEVLSAYGFECD